MARPPGAADRSVVVAVLMTLAVLASQVAGSLAAASAADAPTVSMAPAAAPEPSSGTAVLLFKVTLSQPTLDPVSFTWSTTNGSATAPDDFVAITNAQATIGSGKVSKTLGVTIKSDAAAAEGSEAFTVKLTGITGGQPGVTSATMTIAPSCTITGTDDQETLTGTNGDDVICALDGNDTVRPGLGDDVVFGGDGADTVSYSNVAGPVTVNLATRRATGAGTDTVWSVERIIGSPLDDILRGDALNNSIKGQDGNDTLVGGAGDDRLEGQGGAFDTVDYSNAPGSVDVDLAADAATGEAGTDLVKTIERIVGSSADDMLRGDDGPNLIRGQGGDDTILGVAGSDSLFGGNGRDTIHGGDDADAVLNGQAGDFDEVFGDGGDEAGQPRQIFGGDGAHDWCTDGGTVDDPPLAGGGCENDVIN